MCSQWYNPIARQAMLYSLQKRHGFKRLPNKKVIVKAIKKVKQKNRARREAGHKNQANANITSMQKLYIYRKGTSSGPKMAGEKSAYEKPAIKQVKPSFTNLQPRGSAKRIFKEL